MITHEDLGQRLSALRADFAALATRAADAASALAAKLPPPPALLDELSAARQAFDDLRGAMLEHAGTLDLVLDSERLGTLRDLEPVLAAIGAAEARRARLLAWEEARESALVVLDRVMALIHRDEKGFAALAECQGRARDLHNVLAGSVPEDLEHETVMLSGRLRPFAELLTLVDGWNVLDDNRCAFLQDAITQSFGRPLALAALRGKLGREGEVPPPQPGVRGHGPAPEVAYPPPGYQTPPGLPAGTAPRVPALGAPGALGGTPPTGGVVGSDAGLTATAGAGASAVVPGGVTVSGGGGVAGAANSLVVEIRLSGDKITVETPEARKEREELLERLAQESAQWWIVARQGWTTMCERGATLAEAAREYVQRFPYLLSVPLQKSAEAAWGEVAEGYALLLAHIEKQEEGFVHQALTRLNPQFTTREKDQSYPLGQELYLYVVAEGRLYKTYPDFVKDVVVNALPAAGPWVQGGLIESDDQTRLFRRPETLGSTRDRTETLTGGKERIGPHVFTVTAGPLTTRFFTLRLARETLVDPPDVEIKLKENDAPTDHAWLITLPMPGKVQPLAPRKHRPGGTTLPGFGTEYSGLWIAVFNADPGNDRSYELSIVLRRTPPPEASKPDSRAAGAPPTAASTFFGKKR